MLCSIDITQVLSVILSLSGYAIWCVIRHSVVSYVIVAWHTLVCCQRPCCIAYTIVSCHTSVTFYTQLGCTIRHCVVPYAIMLCHTQLCCATRHTVSCYTPLCLAIRRCVLPYATVSCPGPLWAADIALCAPMADWTGISAALNYAIFCFNFLSRAGMVDCAVTSVSAVYCNVVCFW